MAMVEKKVPYEVDGRQFEGKIVYDDSVTGKRPAIYMQPDWKGIDPDTTGQAREVAGKDYVVLMADMFGKGYGEIKKDETQLRAGMLAVHRDRPFTIACGKKSFDTMRDEADKLGLIEPAKSAAIGYCAGGGYVLELARAGAPFKAVVVFHVTNPNPVVPGTPCNIKGRVLAVHGRADPITPKDKMDAFEDEMTKSKIDWHVVMFGRGVHSFCDRTAHNPAAAQFDEKLCRTSYMLMRDFFTETL